MAKTVKKTVAWFLPDKNPPLIKFVGEDDALALADNVIEISNFQKYPIRKNDIVNVIIDNDEVVYIRKNTSKKSAKTESPKEEKEPASNETKSNVKTVIIQAVARNKKVLKITNDNTWYEIADNIQNQDYQAIGLVAKNEVNLTFENNIIVAVEVIAQPKKEEPIKKETKSSYRDEDATTRRTAVMTAKDIVVALINNGQIEKKNIAEALKDLTQTCRELM